MRFHAHDPRSESHPHTAVREESFDVLRVLGTCGAHQPVAAFEDRDREMAARQRWVAWKQGLARHLDQLGGDLYPGHPATHDHEGQQPAALGVGVGLLRHLEQLDDPGPQRHRVDDGLERPGVLLGTRHSEPVRDATDRDHKRVVGLHESVVQLHALRIEVDAANLVLLEPDVAMACHVPERVDDVARLDRSDGDRRQERVELEEVLLVDQERVPVFTRRARLADRASHVEAAEATAEDEKSMSRHAVQDRRTRRWT